MTISNSLGVTNIESGTDVTYTCASFGGRPDPTIDFYKGTVKEATGTSPSISATITVTEAMNAMEMKCVSTNIAGIVESTETITVFSKQTNYTWQDILFD